LWHSIAVVLIRPIHQLAMQIFGGVCEHGGPNTKLMLKKR
jgi:hypothetical protein